MDHMMFKALIITLREKCPNTGVFFRSVFGHFSHSINPKHIERFRAKLFSSQSTIGSIHRGSSVKKVFLKISQNLQKSICVRISFLIKLLAEACNFLKKETLPQVISCELCEIGATLYLRATFFNVNPLVGDSVQRPE